MNNDDSLITLEALIELKHHNIALLLCNFLLSQQVSAKVKPEGNGFVIYCDKAQIDKAKAICEDFIKQPNHPKYQQAAWNNGVVSELKGNDPSVLTLFQKQFIQHAGIVTLTIFALCWLVFIFSLLGWHITIFNHISFFEQLTLTNLIEQPYRLVGPAFFHFSWLHIVFNTMWWWYIGGQVERVLGKGALLNLFFISAVVSSFGEFLVSGPNFGGLSGVVYALFGYIWWYGWLAPEKGLTIPKPLVGFILFFMLLGFADVLPVNMANTAHLLGLVSGCGLAWFKIKTAKKDASS